MRVVVTGGTGFIGGHLLAALVSRGDDVTSFERPGASRTWIAHLPVAVRTSGWSDRAGLAEAVDGADVVFHLAGRTSARTAEEYHRANVDGTASVMRAAATSGNQPPRVVLLSSFSAIGPCRGGELMTARSAPYPMSPYGESKLRAEAVVHAWSDRVPATILRPTSVYGPRERGLLRFFRLVRRGVALAAGDWGRRVQLIHVDDLVRLLLAAAGSPQATGRTWCVAHPEQLTWRSFAGAVGRAVGRAPLMLRVPLPLTGAMARAAELAARLRGRATGLNRYRVRELANDWVCDAESAWTDLGLRPELSLEQGVPATVAWYREAGWL